MPAYLHPLPECDTPGCEQAARWELRNSRNDPITRHCGRHADKALADYLKHHPEERKTW